MLSGHLKAAGHHVPCDLIVGSYLCVHRSPGVFGDHSIHQKVYRVAGANSLSHHDGQHGTPFSQPKDCNVSHYFPGLIKFKMVNHCFIDGKSHYVTGIRVHNNNHASRVFDLFQEVIHNHGVPSQVRGDHGTENLMLAQWMEENMGVDRGSYTWGWSVISFPFGLFGSDRKLTLNYDFQKCP
jgi:hypothetical protein